MVMIFSLVSILSSTLACTGTADAPTPSLLYIYVASTDPHAPCVVRLTAAAYNLTEKLTFARPIVVKGAAPERVVLRAVPSSSHRVLDVAQGISVTLDNVALTGGHVDGDNNGGAISNQGTLTLNNSAVVGNSVSQHGGGINNCDGATLNLINSTVVSNCAGGDGGGVLNSGIMSMIKSTIANNAASGYDGGGIYNDEGILTMRDSSIVGNVASVNGGGIRNYQGELHLQNSQVRSNKGTDDVFSVDG